MSAAPPPPRRPLEQRSLFGEILDWMLAPLLLLWPMSVALTWLVAQGIASKPFDRQLADMALALSKQVAAHAAQAPLPLRPFALPAGAADILHHDEPDDVYVQVAAPGGEVLAGDASLGSPPDEERPLPGDVRYRDAEVHGDRVRVAYTWLAPNRSARDGWLLVQVAETLGKRQRLATEIIKGVIVPQFVVLPLAVLLVWLALVRGIAPLNELQQRIRRRESSDLSPIDEREAPEEVSPLVRAINDLLGRLDRSIAAQRHFWADAAHQLKTPLAGLRTQAELAQREIDEGHYEPQALKKSLQQIALSSQRAAHMVNQLLAMARAENQGQTLARSHVNLARLAAEAVRDAVPRSLAKRIDLGYEGPETSTPSGYSTTSPLRQGGSTLVLGNALLLREMVRNLVDNALQYTPTGGTVTVRVIDDPFGQVVVLQVEDSGPGIPAAEREQVFQPFYRVLGSDVDGSGLGLAIVREIAQRHGATVVLEDANLRHRPGLADQGLAAFGPGARFTLRFPAARADAQGAEHQAPSTRKISRP